MPAQLKTNVSLQGTGCFSIKYHYRCSTLKLEFDSREKSKISNLNLVPSHDVKENTRTRWRISRPDQSPTRDQKYKCNYHRRYKMLRCCCWSISIWAQRQFKWACKTVVRFMKFSSVILVKYCKESKSKENLIFISFLGLSWCWWWVAHWLTRSWISDQLRPSGALCDILYTEKYVLHSYILYFFILGSK